MGSAALLQSLAGDAEKAASMLHTLAPEVHLTSHIYFPFETCACQGLTLQLTPTRLGLAWTTRPL